MANNFKKQIAKRNKQGAQQPAVPGVQENLIQREPSVVHKPSNEGHSMLSDIARPELQASGQIVRVRVSEVYATAQVRPEEDFEEETLDGMNDTYSEVGILTPPRVFPRDKHGYRIWLGETRVRTAKRRGDEFIDVYVGASPADDKKRLLGQMIENLHQSGLKPLATGLGMLELKTNWNMTGEQIAKSLGKPTSFVSKHIKLVQAPAVITSLLQDKITADVDLVYTLCQIYDASPKEAERLANTARSDKLTRSQAKSALDSLKGRGADSEPKTKKASKTKPVEMGENDEPESNNAPTLPKIMVTLGQDTGSILLKVPAESGMVWVEFPDGERCVEAIKLIVRGIKEV